MTERKPPAMGFTSWVDQQITEAEKRGAFEGLPGAGKPIPRREEADYAQAWLRDYLRREGVPAEDLLPAPLRLRKEIERLEETARGLRSEREVRETVRELNQRIMDWRRTPLGPPLFVPLVDEEKTVSAWRAAQPAKPRRSPTARPGSEEPARRRRRRGFFPWLSRGGTPES